VYHASILSQVSETDVQVRCNPHFNKKKISIWLKKRQ